jgi:hypothetical protein
MKRLKTLQIVMVSLGTTMAMAFVGFEVGYALASNEPLEDPSSEFSLRFESTEDVFYELGWEAGHLWMMDTNRDGVLDQWRFWDKAGNQVFWLKDRNFDRKLDEWYKLAGKDKGALARDEDYDGTVDKVSAVVIVRKYQDPLK